MFVIYLRGTKCIDKNSKLFTADSVILISLHVFFIFDVWGRNKQDRGGDTPHVPTDRGASPAYVG